MPLVHQDVTLCVVGVYTPSRDLSPHSTHVPLFLLHQCLAQNLQEAHIISYQWKETMGKSVSIRRVLMVLFHLGFLMIWFPKQLLFCQMPLFCCETIRGNGGLSHPHVSVRFPRGAAEGWKQGGKEVVCVQVRPSHTTQANLLFSTCAMFSLLSSSHIVRATPTIALEKIPRCVA